ncbi:MAG: AlpA family phage regulatory protein [Pseudolabrys sp.]|nr:AlpA family phage regulatory protein [Pseudolabrys sp.]MCW5696154.1 AlpA family phage regulatory protein [Bauldia sp.]
MPIIDDNHFRIIDKKELRKLVPYSLQHIARMEKAGQFPQRIQLGPNRVGWYEHEVLAWMRDRPRAAELKSRASLSLSASPA